MNDDKLIKLLDKIEKIALNDCAIKRLEEQVCNKFLRENKILKKKKRRRKK